MRIWHNILEGLLFILYTSSTLSTLLTNRLYVSFSFLQYYDAGAMSVSLSFESLHLTLRNKPRTKPSLHAGFSFRPLSLLSDQVQSSGTSLMFLALQCWSKAKPVRSTYMIQHAREYDNILEGLLFYNFSAQIPNSLPVSFSFLQYYDAGAMRVSY